MLAGTGSRERTACCSRHAALQSQAHKTDLPQARASNRYRTPTSSFFAVIKMRRLSLRRILIVCTIILSSSEAVCGENSKFNEHCFDIWAPNAHDVVIEDVSGQWKAAMTANRSSGRWVGSAPPEAAKGGCYVVRIQPGNLTRIDPRARDIAVDGSCSILPPFGAHADAYAPFAWRTRRVAIPRERVVIYELHVPSFTSQGTFDAAAERLDHLVELGVTVLELMPVAFYCGDARGWGYGPCAPFAVKPELGGSIGLKRFVDAAAGRGIAVWLDVVRRFFRFTL